MPAAFGLIARLWDFADKPGEPLDEALGGAGFDYLVVPVVTGPLQRFRFHAPDDASEFQTEGGWHYPHKPEAYKSGSLKPHAARWSRKRDRLALLAKSAAKRNLALIPQIDLRGLAELLEHEPRTLARNAWGDPNPGVGACVMNPELRELLRDVVNDLAEREPDGFQIVNWLVDAPVQAYQIRQFDWRPPLRRLLDVCFCPACRQTAAAAGLDADRVAELVRTAAERIHADPEAAAKTSPSEDDLLHQYLNVRRADHREWMAALANSLDGRPLYMLLDSSRLREPHHAFEEEIKPLADAGVIPIFDAPHVDRLDVGLEREILTPLAERKNVTYGQRLPIWRPLFRQADELVRIVMQAIEVGVARIEFDDLDVAPAAAREWLRQAVRYARRA